MAGTDEELSNCNIMLAFGLPVSSEVPESNKENTESSNQEGSSTNNINHYKPQYKPLHLVLSN